ncbi:MAG TPA: chorismate pyruvate-lyase family protein [Candidatus Acidoferrales bacterium]|nr:chorismate pyruvate-lyase family protein [Candidatus Acidoferrales bacterium]
MFSDLQYKLSKLQKLILLTDGSITTLLEVITAKPVTVSTLVQKIVKADNEIAELLEIEEGDSINYRVVTLRNVDSAKPLIYAESYTPISRLLKEFKYDLMKADIPIGKIMQERKIESRREIEKIEMIFNDEYSEIFDVSYHIPMLSRTYNIISNNMVLIRIIETFPLTSFLRFNA